MVTKGSCATMSKSNGRGWRYQCLSCGYQVGLDAAYPKECPGCHAPGWWGHLTPAISQNGVKNNYSYFPVVFNGYKLSRNEAYETLKKQNIFARKYFYPITNSYKCYQDKFNSKETPVAKYISERVLTLPLYADLSLDDVDRICKIILG